MENSSSIQELENLWEIGEKYINIRRDIDIYLTLIIVVFGTFGNLSIIVIMCINKNFLKLTSTMFLVALAISDTLVLLFENLVIWIDFLIENDEQKIQTVTDCKIYYIYYASKTLSAWLIVNISIDRFLIVYFPQKTCKYLSKENTIIRISVLVLLSVLLNIHYLILLHAPKNFEYDCNEDGLINVWNAKVWPILNMFIYSAIPSILLFVLNALIVYKLTVTKLYLKQVHATEQQEVARSSWSQYVNMLSANKQLNITVFAICLSFVVLTLPSSIHTILNNEDIFNGDVYHEHFIRNVSTSYSDFVIKRNDVLKILLVSRILEHMMNFSHAINFFLYIVTSNVFRKQFIVLIFNFKNLFKKILYRAYDLLKFTKERLVYNYAK